MYIWRAAGRVGSGRFGSDFLSPIAGRVGSGRVNVSPGRVGSGPRKVTRGQLCMRQVDRCHATGRQVSYDRSTVVMRQVDRCHATGWQVSWDRCHATGRQVSWDRCHATGRQVYLHVCTSRSRRIRQFQATGVVYDSRIGVFRQRGSNLRLSIMHVLYTSNHFAISNKISRSPSEFLTDT